METWDRPTGILTRLYADRLAVSAAAIAVSLGLAATALNAFAPNRPVERAGELENFYYGSIGADIGGGLPLKVLRVLPAAFPQYLPEGAPHDLTAFGFIQKPGEPLPIGFSIRRQGVDLAGINCGVCHTGQVRETEDSAPMVVPGMPANRLDLHAFFKFLFDVAADPGFTSGRVLDAMRAEGIAEPLDTVIYPTVVDRLRTALLERKEKIGMFFDPDYPPFGPGRVNTFDTFKFDQFRPFYEAHGIELDPKELYGVVDMPSVWNQAPREGLDLHWDGNQTSVRERNFSAAIGAGSRPQDMDIGTLFRIEDWLKTLPPPRYPFAIDADLAEAGAEIYRQKCFSCHDFAGETVATVQPLDLIGTDPHRLWSYTPAVREAQMDYTDGHFWKFRNFSITDGYSSPPLDGIWARAPYLHNGSVPSMWDLLTPGDRPVAFETGIDLYDQAGMGFAAARLEPRGDGFATETGAAYDGRAFVYDTRATGNANTGHAGPAYGTDLDAADKRALIEYLKTL